VSVLPVSDLHEAIESARNNFRTIYLGGIPYLLKQNETAFLSFVCMCAAIDALAGWSYPADVSVADRFAGFIRTRFATEYEGHAVNLYTLRCRVLHNLSPAHFALIHSQRYVHLKPSPIGGHFLSNDRLFADLQNAAESFFCELTTNEAMQATMLARLEDFARGGKIYTAKII
jgi:hypothetical protein